ncbi:AMP-binding protein [uncultured Arcanobacterium sp.]|uniref:AMP-binding protein n=1 Tax=uncultured Arcanobacterium sp. TaxID=487520 RepID=UPI0026046AB9|nr:AMP-binding protein [uncultured Arcanobacterium sp.]
MCIRDSTSIAAAKAEISQFHIPAETGVLMRTSGSTTGEGKIVALSWESLIYSAQVSQLAMGGAGAWITRLPLHHIAGFQAVLRSVLSGYRPFYEYREPDLLAKEKIAGIRRIYRAQVPTQLQEMLENPQLLAQNPATALLIGGAALHTDLQAAAQRAGLNIVTSYGMTETGGGCVYNGLAIGDTQIEIAENGQVSLGGSVVAQGYLKKKTAPPIEEKEFSLRAGTRFHHTRDLGKFTASGKLEILGRIDDAITTGGLTIIPKIVEEAITARFSTVAVVVGVPNKKWGEAAIAITEKPQVETAVRSYLKEKFTGGWVPKRVISWLDLAAVAFAELPANWDENSPHFPRLESGKIDRRQLQLWAKAYMEKNVE